MNRFIGAAMLPLALLGCSKANIHSTALDVCRRADVQELVGKEARSLALRGLHERMLRALIFGAADFQFINKIVEDARVSFGEPDAPDDQNSQVSPFKQVVCVGNMQLDLSTAVEGQQIVAFPHLRWSVNFSQPTDNPVVSPFTIELDGPSLSDGMLVNGKPVEQVQTDGPSVVETLPSAQRAANEADSAASAAASAASEASSVADASGTATR